MSMRRYTVRRRPSNEWELLCPYEWIRRIVDGTGNKILARNLAIGIL
jgi:hypothetical protein